MTGLASSLQQATPIYIFESSIGTPVEWLIAEPTASATGCSLPSVAKPVVKIKGTAETGRTPKGNLTEWNPELEVEAGLEHTVTKIYQRAERVVEPMWGDACTDAPVQ